MRFNKRSVFVCVLVLLCAVGTASAQFTLGPESPGQSGVFRVFVDDGSVRCIGFFDADSLLVSVHCDDDSLFGCQATSESTPLHVQLIERSDDLYNVLILLAPDLVTNVYDVTGFPTIDCAFFINATGRLLASGPAHFTEITNDYGTGEAPGADLLTIKATGTLQTASDETNSGFVLKALRLTLPDGTFVPSVTLIMLNPDPR